MTLVKGLKFPGSCQAGRASDFMDYDKHTKNAKQDYFFLTNEVFDANEC